MAVNEKSQKQNEVYVHKLKPNHKTTLYILLTNKNGCPRTQLTHIQVGANGNGRVLSGGGGGGGRRNAEE